jgi:hypothetical protein
VSQAQRGEFEGDYVVRLPTERHWIGVLVLILTGFAGAFAREAKGGSAHQAALFSLCVLGAIACFVIFRSWQAWVKVDAFGLTWKPSKPPGGVMAWSEIVSVRFVWGWFVVRSSSGDRVTVGARWSNADGFARGVLSCVPQGRLHDARTRAALERIASGSIPRAAARVGRDPGGGSSTAEAIARWQGNPFFVLDVRADCTRAEAERAGEKLLALLGVGASGAKTYATPFGPRERTADAVRAALAEIRDPSRRIAHEVWARVPSADAAPPVDSATSPWEGAMNAAGWRGR